MILSGDNGVSFVGSYGDLDAEVAMILIQYAVTLQHENIPRKQISEDLLNYMKLLNCITECIMSGQSVEDNWSQILDKVFE